MAKNYYVTLGISRGADFNQIKKAYRKVAKKYHPDTTRSDDSRQFREIREAYETLADENARRHYDAQLQGPLAPVCISSVTETIKQRSSPFNGIKGFESLVDEFFEGFVPGLFHKERYRPARTDLYYEIILSPREAMHGGLFPIRVPVIEKCPRCEQTGFWDSLYCPECNGYGYRQAEREFSLSIPPRTTDGTEAVLSLEDIGLPDANLFVRIQIDPYSATRSSTKRKRS
ncbi:MAG: DnaJ domain-containing protein [Desulfobacterales bacterium]